MSAPRFTALLPRAAVVAALISSALFIPAQNSLLQQRVQEIKQSAAANKKARLLTNQSSRHTSQITPETAECPKTRAHTPADRQNHS
jgi:hypothetical protein